MGPALHSVANWVMYRGEDFASEDLRGDARIRSESVGAVLAFPLVCRGRRVGALIGARPRGRRAKKPQLSPAVLTRRCACCSSRRRSALDNALLLKRAEALSVTDDLTQLYNSRYLNQVLRTRNQARVAQRPAAVAAVHRSRRVQERQRHARPSVRQPRAGRGGAPSSAAAPARPTWSRGSAATSSPLVLPDTGGEGAFAVGERVRERIAAHSFLAGDGLDIRLTASVGVATLPDVAASAEELVQAADTAMYRVKDSGKNGIQAAVAPADT